MFFFNGMKFFTYGGGTSVDKMYRREGISWWPEEIPGFTTETHALKMLEKYGNKVDVILTHTAPNTLIPNDHYKRDYPICPVSKFLDHVLSIVEYKMWFCGHFHIDIIHSCNLRYLYHQVARIPDS
jgi:hypothetical protein